MKNSSISKAIDATGSQSKLAKLCGCSQTAIWKIVVGKTKTITPGMAIKIEKATNGIVSRYEMCPEIFDATPGSDDPASTNPLQHSTRESIA